MLKKILPVEPGNILEIKIEGINHQGEGVGRYKGLAVFVPWTVPGEKTKIKITETKKNFARGKLLELIKPSPFRVEAKCEHYTRCGGCRFQHIQYHEQLEIKTRLVRDSIQRIGKLENINVNPAIGMENPWRYRNKVSYKVLEEKSRIRLGYYAEDGDEVFPVINSLLVNDSLSETAFLLEELLNKFNLRAFNRDENKGLLRHAVLRSSARTGEIMVILVTTGEKFPGEDNFAGELMKKNPKVVSVVRNINHFRGNAILGPESKVIKGRGYLTDWIGDVEYKISPVSFFQVNPVQTETLFKKAVEYARLTGQETVIDIYCGIGAISLFLARKADRVYGIEVVTDAVRDASENARLNNITNAEFIAGKAETELPRLLKRGVKPDVIVVDPPRKGVDRETLEAMVKMAPERIVYVSCNPASLARDLGYLDSRGYRTLEIQPVDMFPWTKHIEVVVSLKRKHSP